MVRFKGKLSGISAKPVNYDVCKLSFKIKSEFTSDAGKKLVEELEQMSLVDIRVMDQHSNDRTVGNFADMRLEDITQKSGPGFVSVTLTFEVGLAYGQVGEKLFKAYKFEKLESVFEIEPV